jgi:Stigma-specific protein, Stig1
METLLACGLVLACSGNKVSRDAAATADGAGADARRDGPADASSATQPDGRCVPGAFPHKNGICMCQSDTPTVCDALCVDLTSDPDNCGACDHACAPQATCGAGACGPSPTVARAAPAACGKMALVANNGTLYWTDTVNGVVMRMPAAGGDATQISGPETTAPTHLLVNGTTVFWVDGATIRTSAGSVVSTVYTAPGGVRGIALSDDAATMYFSWGSKIQSVPVVGGQPTDVVLQDSGGEPAAMAVQGNLMVFLIGVLGGIDVTQLGPVVAHCWTIDPDASTDNTDLDVNCDRLGYANAGLNTNVVIAAGANVVFIDGPALEMNAFAADAAQAHEDIFSADDDPSDFIQAMVLAGGQIFFADSAGPTSGEVQRVSPTYNATSVPLARNLNGPTSVAVDGQRVFWTTSDCEIRTTATGL